MAKVGHGLDVHTALTESSVTTRIKRAIVDADLSFNGCRASTRAVTIALAVSSRLDPRGYSVGRALHGRYRRSEGSLGPGSIRHNRSGNRLRPRCPEAARPLASHQPEAKCAGGSSWRETWSPAEGAQAQFTATGRSFFTEQHVSTSYRRGIVGRIGFAIRGTLTGRDSAQGTIRLVARFYRGERQWNACDSLDVRWAVGPRASMRLRTVPVTGIPQL